MDIAESTVNEQLLSKLLRADGAAINSFARQHEPSCLLGTRLDLLKQVREWSNSHQGKCLFWLNGMAGTGKSTIARTVAREGSKENRLGASFFFSKGGGDRGHARMFFGTLALQLAEMSPILKRYICEAIAENGDIAQHGLSDQWEKLIFQPLSILKSSQIRAPTMLLVIDALDECESYDDIRLILRLLAEAKNLTRIHLRIFVTSRPEFPILREFRDIPTDAHQDFILHNISESIVEHDISIFVKNELSQIRRDQELSIDWPGEQNIKLLVNRANGLFIYIATVCRFVSKSKFPERRLIQVIQGGDAKQGPEQNLDEIYMQILRDSLIGDSDKQDEGEVIELFQQTVGSIVVLFDLLSIIAVSKLLFIELREIKLIMRYLRSVIDVPGKEDSPIKLLHPSFRDFLLDKQRCRDKRFWIAKHEAHSDLCNNCLRLMSNTLHRDICGLGKPGTLAKDIGISVLARYVPGHVQYACRYWFKHLQQLEHDLREKAGLYRKVQVFLENHFLHWLETLSIMGKISEGIVIMTDLQSMLTVSSYLLLGYNTVHSTDSHPVK
jgi:NACHT domain